MSANFEQTYEFLRSHYLHSRFEGSPNCKDFPEYPSVVTRSTMQQVEKTGRGFISHFESNSGRVIIFDIDLNILNPDEPQTEIQHRAGNLTHIYGH